MMILSEQSSSIVNSSEYYEYDSQYQVWKDKTDNEDYMKSTL